MATYDRELKLAVLIDADNVPYAAISEMMEEVGKYGMPTYKRIYGDFTSNRLQGWKEALNEHAITPMQQYSYTSGKNATDSALIIDAMDILYTGDVDGFFIVSSDSDFTKLATRLREKGKRVYGMGEKKTPKPFITACEKFIYIEVLRQDQAKAKPGKDAKDPKSVEPDQAAAITDKSLRKLVLSTIEDFADEQGWLPMAALGNSILKKKPEFDARNYGFKRLSDLIKALPYVDVHERQTTSGNKHEFVRWK
jgi:uncharacterized LabA/DUF88 family protein